MNMLKQQRIKENGVNSIDENVINEATNKFSSNQK